MESIWAPRNSAGQLPTSDMRSRSSPYQSIVAEHAYAWNLHSVMLSEPNRSEVHDIDVSRHRRYRPIYELEKMVNSTTTDLGEAGSRNVPLD